MKKFFLVITLLLIISGCRPKDQDGNSFKTIKIGNQTWMAENLNVKHYLNGDAIPQVQDKIDWAKLKTGAWCYYDNDPENGKKYGVLYNWYAVNDARGLAPKGWHIPSDAEFVSLVNAVNDDGNPLKAVGQGTGSGAGTNTSGFSALLAGMRTYYSEVSETNPDSMISYGEFDGLGVYVNYWSSRDFDAGSAAALGLDKVHNGIYKISHYKVDGFSVRCVKDN